MNSLFGSNPSSNLKLGLDNRSAKRFSSRRQMCFWFMPTWMLTALTMATGCTGPRQHDYEGSFRAVEIPKPFCIQLVGEKKTWSAKLPELFDSNHRLVLPSVSLRSGDAIHIPAGIDLRLELSSIDYVYTFTVVESRIKEISVPTLKFELLVPAQPVRQLTIVSEPLCGDPHRYETISIVVDSRDDFLAWFRWKSSGAPHS